MNISSRPVGNYMRKFAGIFLILLCFFASIYPVMASGTPASLRCATGTGVQIIDDGEGTQDANPPAQDGSTGSQNAGNLKPEKTPSPAPQETPGKNPVVPGDVAAADTTPGIPEAPQIPSWKEVRDAQISAEILVIRERIGKERGEQEPALRAMPEDQQYRARSISDTRCALGALVAVENLTGVIGPLVSDICRDMNATLQSEWALEEELGESNGITRFVFGGNEGASGQIAVFTGETRLRTREIGLLMDCIALHPDIRDLMNEQLTIIDREQERLDSVAQQENEKRGLLDWR